MQELYCPYCSWTEDCDPSTTEGMAKALVSAVEHRSDCGPIELRLMATLQLMAWEAEMQQQISMN